MCPNKTINSYYYGTILPIHMISYYYSTIHFLTIIQLFSHWNNWLALEPGLLKIYAVGQIGPRKQKGPDQKVVSNLNNPLRRIRQKKIKTKFIRRCNFFQTQILVKQRQSRIYDIWPNTVTINLTRKWRFKVRDRFSLT